MKYLFYVSICLSLVLAGCSKDDAVIDNGESSDIFDNPMRHIGEIHNDGLNSIATNHVSIDSICEFTQEYVEAQFAQSQHNCVIPENYSYESMNLAKRIGIERMSTYSYTRNNSESMTADSIYSELPSNCKIYIDNLIEIITANESNIDNIRYKISQIDQNINNALDLTSEEKNCLWACSAITLSSYIYNLDNIKTRAVTAEGVVRADLEGAVGSFLSWKFWGKTAGGLMFGPTGAVMTASKEIVKGAIVGSGVNVISGLLW